MIKDFISIIIVNYNGKSYLHDCLTSMRSQDFPQDQYEIIMVDNVSSDDSVQMVKDNFPKIQIIKSDKNNYCFACNQGIRASKGEYILLANFDMIFDKFWLKELFRAIQKDAKCAGVQSMILYEDGTICSLGGQQNKNFLFKDIQDDSIDPANIVSLCGGSSLYRKKCLKKAGCLDEDFLIFYEDVDLGFTLKKLGFRLAIQKKSIAYHKKDPNIVHVLTDFLCGRNRFGLIAKHAPHLFPGFIHDSHTLSFDHERHYQYLLFGIFKLYKHFDYFHQSKLKNEIFERVSLIFGLKKTMAIFRRCEAVHTGRKLKIAIFDHSFHLIGGGQKVNAQLAHFLQDDFDVHIHGLNEFDLKEVQKRDGMDLSHTQYHKIQFPFSEKLDTDLFDPGLIKPPRKNDFEVMSKKSLDFDVFINGSMIPQIDPQSPISLFYCHFPMDPRNGYFFVDQYDIIFANSNYTMGHLDKKWGIRADAVVYPAVDSFYPKKEKKNIILSLSRFEPGGTKKQSEMIDAFQSLCSKHPNFSESWDFHLVGGSAKNFYSDGRIHSNVYLDKLREKIEKSPFWDRIHLHVNADIQLTKKLLQEAKIFWHFCGFEAKNPMHFEHFGMATVEAMQNFSVPVVYNGGGQSEIISKHGEEGFLFNTIDECLSFTSILANSPERLQHMAQLAHQRSLIYSLPSLKNRLTNFFHQLKDVFFNVCPENIERVFANYNLNNPLEQKIIELRKGIHILKFSAESQQVHYQGKNVYCVILQNTSHQISKLKLVFDIFFGIKEHLPGNHYFYSSIMVTLESFETIKLQITYDWESKAIFSIKGKKIPPVGMWKEDHLKEGPYNVYAALMSSDDSNLESMRLPQKFMK